MMLINPYRFASGIGGNDAFTVLLIHCEGADGSTSFADSSASAHSVTAFGNAQMDTGITPPFGTSSLLLDGNDALILDDSADWDFGTGDLTVDLWARLSSPASRQVLISNYNNSTGWFLQKNNDNTLRWGWGNGVSISASWTPSADTWYHVAVTRASSVLRLFVNGAQIGSDTANSTNLSGSSAQINIGALTGAGQFTTGSMKEIRISKGIARWTSNFTPPSQPYS